MSDLAPSLRAIVLKHIPLATRDTDDITMTRATLLALMGQAAKLEREACADIADEHAVGYGAYGKAAAQVRDAIESRGRQNDT